MAVKKSNTSTTKAGKTSTPAIPSRNDMFDAASLKLNTASAIVDAVVMLNVGGNMDTLKKGSLTACLLHADELLDEARQMFSEAQQPLQAKGVSHG